MQAPKDSRAQVTGGVWHQESFAETPEIVVTDWNVFEVQLPGRSALTRHIVALRRRQREGVVSSAITSVEATANRFATESGRTYVVRGSTGGNLDSDYVWRIWLQRNGVTGAENVTSEVLLSLSVVLANWHITDHPHHNDPRRKILRLSGIVQVSNAAYSCDVQRLNRTKMEGIDTDGRFFKLVGSGK